MIAKSLKHKKMQTFEQIPQPIQSSSDMKAILSAGETSMQRRPNNQTNKNRIHLLAFTI